MCPLKQIQSDIERCQNQIASTYDQQFDQNCESTKITREGFQRQLCKLFAKESHQIEQIEVTGAEII